jgi:ribonuclease Z
MRPTFLPRLINDPFDDPGVFLPFIFEKRAFLFDPGDIHALSARDILKISHVFVSHTHMDHFADFDRLLRLLLGRGKTLYLFGPGGFLENLAGKLAGYTWNLTESYRYPLILEATEVSKKGFIRRRFSCSSGFRGRENPREEPFSEKLVDLPDLKVTTAILKHRIPCLGFAVEERFHINIIKEKLLKLGLEPGPWLQEFKAKLYGSYDPDSEYVVTQGAVSRTFRMGDLARRIALFSNGQKVGYITDVAYTPANVDKIVALVKGADQLFIEAVFLEKDRCQAEQKAHLTARQAGHIAALAKVKNFSIFHFSPRYTGQGHLLEEEARAAFSESILIDDI